MVAVTDQKQLDFRRAQRQRRLKTGKIIFLDHKRVFDCLIQDWSDTGAKLRMSNSLEIPDTFDLALKSENLVVTCTVRWRRGENIGVRFAGPARNLTVKKPRAANPQS
jgi:hypothetical protein